MSRRRTAALQGSGLFMASIGETLVPLVRNIVLARMIAPHEFGLAITLAVVIGVIEVLSDFGIPVFIARRPRHLPSQATLDTLHSLALLRSLLIGIVLAAAAPLLASGFSAPEATLGFAALGVVAMLRGLENLGGKALMRSRRFAAEALMLAGSQLALLTVTIAAAFVTGSYVCIVWGMLAQTLAVIALSHALSPRRWRLGWNSAVVAEAVRFGRPLLINGAAAAAGSGDRLIVGGVLGPAPLAIYNVAVGSALLPRSVLARFLTSTFVPLFASVRAKAERARRLSDAWGFCLSLLALCYGAAVALAGGPVLGIVFGAAYEPAPALMSALALAVTVRFLLLLPVPPAYALGDTRLVTAASLAPALSLLLGGPVLIVTREPALFLLTCAAVEFTALVLLTRLALPRLSFSRAPLWMLVLSPPLVVSALPLIRMIEPGRAVVSDLAQGAIAIATVAAYAAIGRRFAIRPGAVLS